jgi:tryptophan-rich sensory protein
MTPALPYDVPRRGLAARATALAAFAGATAAASALGGRATRSRVRRPWYRLLSKPAAQPPSWAFGPVWTALYASIAYSGYRVWRSRAPGRGRALGWWAAQLALNASWSPLFFGARRPRAALGVVAAMVPSIATYAWSARRVDRGAAALVLPYLAWTSFALYLNAGIVARNASTLARR